MKYLRLILMIGALSTLTALAAGPEQAALQARLSAAKPGDVITLEAKTYQAGDLSVPAGVTLRGAGFDKTTLDATGCKNGLSITGGSGTVVSDLTVRNAAENGITVSGATRMSLARIRLADNLTGLALEKVEDGRVENAVISTNRTGAVMSSSTGSAIINCSFVNNSAIALALAENRNCGVFNNVFLNSPTGLVVDAGNEGLLLDYNLTFNSFLGKLEGEVARTTLPGWQRVSGFDAHSVSMSVEFADAAKGDFSPVSTLAWAPGLPTTAGWGVAKLGTFEAPATDILGNKRSGGIGVGAYEVKFPIARKPDGSLMITSSDGVKSAALYDEKGVQVAMLFQNMPFSKGKLDFWVPDRDTWNRPLPEGRYEARLVESQLTNEYLGLAGNMGVSSDLLDGCSWSEEQFAFDAQDRLYVLQDAFENGTGIRAYDGDYKTRRWMLPGGGGNIGSATDGSWLYFLQRQGIEKTLKYNLRKINLETGMIEPIVPGSSNRVFTDVFSPEAYGMALLNGRLYVSDPIKGKIFYTDAKDPKFTESFDVPGALSVTADSKTGLLWVIDAEGKLRALDPATGAVKATATPTTGIKRINANNGRLAVLSTTTGKVQVFDATDPASLKLVQTIGSGDGPEGPIKPDRFWFQEAKNSKPVKMNVAINSRGDVAVVDSMRISFWGADGSLKKQGMGFWGQHNYVARFAGDDDVRIWGVDGSYSIKMDSKNKTWAPDTRWSFPDYEYAGRSPRNFFTAGGKNFGVFAVTLGDPAKTADGKLQTSGKIDPKQQTKGYLVVRMEERKAVPVSLYYRDGKLLTLMELHDTNKDGIIDAQDAAVEIRQADGSPVAFPTDRYDGSLPWDASGDFAFSSGIGADSTGRIVKMTGLDPTGMVPVYNWANPEIVPCTFDGKSATMPSPYDYKTSEVLNLSVQLAKLSDGGYASSFRLKTSGGTGLANGAGTDIAGFGKDGRFRWLYRLNNLQGSEGVQALPTFNLVMGMTSTQCDYMVMDGDGLGLGALAMPKEAHWQGMWSDHAQQQAVWVGNDGKPYYILGDYAANGFHWFSILGTEKTKRQRVPVKIDAQTAAQLATGPELKPVKVAELPKPHVIVRRLATPLPIDGDLKKWRAAGIAPTAIVTPETGSANIKGPKDCSAIIRLAYYGNDLYVQTIVFDDLVTMHQNTAGMSRQDGIEMGINSYMQGFKYNVSVTTDNGPTVFRNKFVVPTAERLYTPEQVPRSITVLDNAKDVEERHFIEAIYGVDLSNSKVIVTEFKLPLTPEVGLDGDPKLIEKIGPGGTFWIGFFINDNDMPGGDVQDFLAWPATYGTFTVKEFGTLATFE